MFHKPYVKLLSIALWAMCLSRPGPILTAERPDAATRRPIGELRPSATVRLGKTADWVAVAPDAVWVGTTGPFAVSRIDPATNKRVARVSLPGEPCAGLAIGFGSLWVPLCGRPSSLARIDLKSNALIRILNIGPGAAEGGITTSADSVWLVVDNSGSLARIDPDTALVRQIVRLPPGSYNPLFSDGRIWVTHAAGSQVTSVDAVTGKVLLTMQTGPGPRFLTAGAGAVWTLNQGDGSLTRIHPDQRHASETIALGSPGHGGDIGYGSGMIWTTVSKVPLSIIEAASMRLLCQWTGPGGDSLGIGHGAVWLTNYHAGTVSRIEIGAVMASCARN